MSWKPSPTASRRLRNQESIGPGSRLESLDVEGCRRASVPGARGRWQNSRPRRGPERRRRILLPHVVRRPVPGDDGRVAPDSFVEAHVSEAEWSEVGNGVVVHRVYRSGPEPTARRALLVRFPSGSRWPGVDVHAAIRDRHRRPHPCRWPAGRDHRLPRECDHVARKPQSIAGCPAIRSPRRTRSRGTRWLAAGRGALR
jgi:hypothetical protein